MAAGHAVPDDLRSTLDWAALARGGTMLVVLMGLRTLPSIVRALIDAGRDGDAPVACVMDGGLPSQQVVLTTLAAIISSGPHPSYVLLR